MNSSLSIPQTSKYTLRPYQARAVRLSVGYLTTSFYEGPGLIVLPTGSGKSLVIAGIVNELPESCLILQPSREILNQNAEKLRGYGYYPAIYSASLGRKEIGRITLATVGSIVKTVTEDGMFVRREMCEGLEDVKYVLIDECDLVNSKVGLYKDLFELLPDARFIGLTATPYRLSTDSFGGAKLKFLTRTRPRIFKHLVYFVQNRDLFDQGFLCPLQYKKIESRLDPENVKVNSTGAEYEEASLGRELDRIKFREEIVKTVKFLNDKGRSGILIFTSRIEDAQYVKDNVPDCAIVTGETNPDERRRVISGFRTGGIRNVVNVGVLAVGFDYPQLSTVVLARLTMSLRIYYQQAGRVVRTHPDKKTAWIVDMVGLVKKFGRLEDLYLENPGREMWEVKTQGRALTNVYFGNPPENKFMRGRRKSMMRQDKLKGRGF